MDVLASTTIFTTATTHHYLHHITIKSTRPSLTSRPSCLPLPGCLCGTLRRGGWPSRWWWPSPPPRATSSLASTFRTGCQACSWFYGILQILDIIFHPNFECCILVLHPYHFSRMFTPLLIVLPQPPLHLNNYTSPILLNAQMPGKTQTGGPAAWLRPEQIIQSMFVSCYVRVKN